MKHRLFYLATAIALLSLLPRPIAAREWSKIESKSELKIAIKDNIRPLGFINKNGDLQGLEIDIAHKLGEELLGDAESVKLIAVDNEERLGVVLQDEVDIAIARVSVTTSRSRIVDFSPHYYLDGTSLITTNTQIKNADSPLLNRIAVLKNSVTIAVIRHRFPQTSLIGVDSYQEALEIMESNQADAFAGDRSVLTGWIQEYPAYQLLPERFSGAALAIVMPKGLQYKDLRSQINQAIRQWKKSGWLEERIKYWGLFTD